MSQTPSKLGQKMCKSPKNSTNFHNIKHEKIDYEHLNTNCTVVGSNNLNLVKKPQIVTSMSPAYSNTNSSPVYPASPYSSPASLKSPSPNLKPPTPQPQTFPVMQIIHNNHHLLARPIQQQQQNIIKLKPHLNILPKPSGSPQPSPKASVSPQIMIPTNTHQQATLMQSTQPLLLNQMPMLAATPGVQFILKPQAATKMQTATATPQGLILQQGSQPIIQLQQPRSQPMVRVLTNSVQIGPTTTTPTAYVQMSNIPMNNTSPSLSAQSPQHIQSHVKRKPKAKVKKKLDLANIMKLSGIGDEDDIQFESDTSQSENEHNPGSTTPQPQQNIQMQANTMHQANTIQAQNILHQSDGKKIGNIQIQGIAQPTINAAAAPVVQVLNQNFQSGMISNSTSQASGQTSIPFSPFITPNFTINNGLMVQRSGGFKLAMGEDGRLVLQHDPTLNQDLQSQLILQSIFGLNGGLVLQPSLDQQTVQQTVQTIQQQSVQTIQQQTVQSQTIQTVQQQTVQPQTVQHSIQALQPQIQQQTVQQTIQHQTVQSQPIAAIQQPMQIVQPQPIHSMQSQVQPSVHSIQSHVHSLQSQLQGQIHSLLQQQNHALQQNNQPQSIQAVQPVQHQPIQALTSLPQQSPVQNVHHNVHSHQGHSQPVLKVQPFQKSQLPVQTVHPQPVQSVQPQPIQAVQPMQAVNPQPVHSQLPIQTVQPNVEGSNQQQPTSYVVNLTPDQLEQLKRNGQLTVNGQTIFMPRSNQLSKQSESNFISDKKLSPKIKPVKKIHKIQAVKNLTQENVESVKPVITINHQVTKEVKTALQNPPKTLAQAQPVQPQPIQKPAQPSALVQPQPMVQAIPPKAAEKNKPHNQQKVLPNTQNTQTTEPNGNQEVDKLLGQLLEESNSINIITSASNVPPPNMQHQRIHTIQLTPQKQQHLKNIQVQIQSLSSQLSSGSGNSEIQGTLKNLFAEQQKILATGKLLPPDKVYYHNNQLTIVNPSSLNSPPPSGAQLKSDPSPVSAQMQQHSNNNVRRTIAETSPAYHQTSTTQASPSPRIPCLVPPTESIPTQNIHQQQNHQHPPNISQHLLQHSNQHGIQGHHLGQQQHLNSSNQNQTFNNSSVISSKSSNNVITSMPPPTQLSPQQQYNLLAKRTHLIEAQLAQDQADAVKPDVVTPFRNKKDACVRLIKYHCLDQPVLSQKDLNKADEIFEVTARHFISKYDKMMDKYKYLLLKESQRQVQTSELMMLDRLFLSDEQQSLMKLRHDAEEAQYMELNQMQETKSAPPPVLSQGLRHLQQFSNNQSTPQNHSTQFQFGHNSLGSVGQGQHMAISKHNQVIQSPYSSSHNSKNFGHQFIQSQHLNSPASRQINEHNQNSSGRNLHQPSQIQQQTGPGNYHISHGVDQSAQNHHQPELSHQSSQSQHHSGQNHQLSGQGHNQASQSSTQSGHNEHQLTSSHQNVQNPSGTLTGEEYDEWACIQRELGCLHNDDHKSNFVEQTAPEQLSNNAHQPPKRSASSDSRLETLKRFRVDKHHKKTLDNVHNSVNSVVQSVSNSLPQNTHLTMMSQSCLTSRYQSSYENQSQFTYNCLETEEGIEGKSIDEQVQSAIDSILNLQQNTALDLDSILS